MSATRKRPQRQKPQKPQKQREQRAAIRPNELVWVRLGILFLVLGAVAVAFYWVQQKLADPALLPVQSVVLDGDFLHTERDELQKVIGDAIHGGYFTIDVREVQALLEGDPDNEMILDMAAFTFYTSGMLKEALACYEKLVKVDSKRPLYHFYLGNTYFKLDRREDACKQW